MIPWVIPIWMLTAVVLVTISGMLAIILALVTGFYAFPFIADYIRSHAGMADADPVEYWRIKLR
jgi:hypothetical protein